jgi:RimJ/RimL family protein N-acetyltransferase
MRATRYYHRNSIFKSSETEKCCVLIIADDAVFAGLENGEAPAGLRLVPGGLETPDIMAMLRMLAVSIREAFEPAAWLVVENGEVVGMCSLKNAPCDRGSVEIGYGIAPARQRTGAATRAVAEVLAWAKTDARVAKVTAQTAVENAASHKVLERNGFTQTGHRHDEEDGKLLCWEHQV